MLCYKDKGDDYMRIKLGLFLGVIFFTLLCSGCTSTSNDNSNYTESSIVKEDSTSSTAKNNSASSYSETSNKYSSIVEEYSSYSSNKDTYNYDSKPLFTNAYGTPTTKCAHSGCDNYIASSGDTNCCTLHSNKCRECGKYIDEDAMYCITCLTNALSQVYEDNYN